jgi:hypothetical protein
VAHVHVETIPSAIAGAVEHFVEMAVAGIDVAGFGREARDEIGGKFGVQVQGRLLDDTLGDDLGPEQRIAFDAGGEDVIRSRAA